LAVARAFGRRGFQVALIARRPERLEGYVQELAQVGIEAAGFVADVRDTDQLTSALRRDAGRFGSIDVLEYSPYASDMERVSPLALTVESVLEAFRPMVLGAITAANAVLPSMLERGRGALFFTTGTSAVTPLPFIANWGIATSGLRNYVRCLHAELAPRDIYAGLVVITALIEAGGPADPDKIAALYLDMYDRRDRPEEVFRPGG
jgi:short-subunit dehydrogenase